MTILPNNDQAYLLAKPNQLPVEPTWLVQVGLESCNKNFPIHQTRYPCIMSAQQQPGEEVFQTSARSMTLGACDKR